MMGDQQELALLYDEMYMAMIGKDRPALEALHDASFTLTHMTGLCQDKKAYLDSIMDGTLNYYSAVSEDLDIQIDGDQARMIGRSRVVAAVYGGGRRSWPLRLDLQLVRRDGMWRLLSAKASTY